MLSYKEFKEKYNINLDPQQEAAVQSLDGPCLILAVPGSGKTTVLINRLGYMVYGQNIAPESILTVTYTVAATRDMSKRFLEAFGEEYANRLEFRTINGLSQKILSYYGSVTGKKPFDLADKEAAVLAKEAFRLVNKGFATDNDVSNMLTAISFVKNMGYSAAEIKSYKCEVNNFPQIYQTYNQLLKDRQLIDYDDQMVYALKLLRIFPDLLKHFQQKYQYFLVDEAQDTSKIQHEIIALLSSHTDNLFMVGDEDQSIYGFRAAYPQALMDFEKNHKGAKVYFLETNYRSKKDIVDAAGLIIKKNTIRRAKNLQAFQQEAGKVIRLDTASRGAQYKYICDKLTSERGRMAILYRNNESALPLIDMLERYGIAYRLKNNDASFFSHPVINDIRDFAALSQNPSDDQVFMGIYYKMNVGISKVLAQEAIYNCGSEGCLEYIAYCDSASAGVRKRCKSLAGHLKKLKTDSAQAALDRILDQMGYSKYMDSRSMDSGKVDILKMLSRQVPNLYELFSRMDMLQEIMAEGHFDRDAHVTLSTIHSAKGLEYDCVYMLDMIDGILPSMSKPGRYASPDEINAYEEERRLYYVAATRAREELYIFTFDYASTSPFSRELFAMKRPKDTIQSSAPKSKAPWLLTTNYGSARPDRN